ncbi:alpha/beta-hydrolase [Hyaloscypha variabilis F]|uniref:Alpha/beta-hydrolase n=1 Tax=Hyaloscypha variabilis (strain UAMH 11265 / GT02V1 / F) TaxID=1149755 RepID=A0A2J6QUG7_HYAVF|nr:alpha/beta-hydrolase [Hyaloscypha variabilis F]
MDNTQVREAATQGIYLQLKEAAHHRSFFYVGGEYVKTSAGYVLQDQMYVERLLPIGGSKQPYPIVFLHGGAQTGTNWLNKPDGEKGWASWFIDRGYEVYIIDQPHTGRSAWDPDSSFPLRSVPAEYIENRMTATAHYKLWPQAHLHTQWPGTGKMGDPVFDSYYASTVPMLKSFSEQERCMKAAGAALLDKVGSAILIAHSQGGMLAWSLADERPQLVKALIARPWALTTIPLTYSPQPTDIVKPLSTKVIPSDSPKFFDCILQEEPARQLVNLKEIPILIETGEASYHAMYDHCTFEFMKQAGCRRVEHIKLADIGIHGNGHLQFLEKNSDEIAEVIEKWVEKAVGEKKI